MGVRSMHACLYIRYPLMGVRSMLGCLTEGQL